MIQEKPETGLEIPKREKHQGQIFAQSRPMSYGIFTDAVFVRQNEISLHFCHQNPVPNRLFYLIFSFLQLIPLLSGLTY